MQSPLSRRDLLNLLNRLAPVVRVEALPVVWPEWRGMPLPRLLLMPRTIIKREPLRSIAPLKPSAEAAATPTWARQGLGYRVC